MALADNLVSYWKLDEASGSALDAHASNDLTETSGTIGTGTGIISGARDFEAGDTEYFNLASASANDLDPSPDSDFTIVAWIQLESSTGSTQSVVSRWSTSANNSKYELGVVSTGAPFFRVSDGSSAPLATWGSNLSTATWYMLAGRYDATTGNLTSISVNAGTPVTASHSGGINTTDQDFQIGRQGTFGGYFDGLIDEVGYWARHLSDAEITELYNSGAGRDYAYITGGGGAGAARRLTLLGVG